MSRIMTAEEITEAARRIRRTHMKSEMSRWLELLEKKDPIPEFSEKKLRRELRVSSWLARRLRNGAVYLEIAADGFNATANAFNKYKILLKEEIQKRSPTVH